ncbi:MAG: putative rane protein [Anaerolineales bacterium]|jgi:NADH:ubiquinone oxidoreductase subunit 3 (subunit A)|nr:putative membrane protein [Anaerolineales bacterium]MBM2843189.1 putative rane protein [Anaerolineales bacterium]
MTETFNPLLILAPPAAFLIYLMLVTALAGAGRYLAGPAKATALKTSTYASGEAPPQTAGAPGYRPFFVVALFFTILHLGVLMLGSSHFLPMSGVYLVGLMLALLALILG